MQRVNELFTSHNLIHSNSNSLAHDSNKQQRIQQQRNSKLPQKRRKKRKVPQAQAQTNSSDGSRSTSKIRRRSANERTKKKHTQNNFCARALPLSTTQKHNENKLDVRMLHVRVRNFLFHSLSFIIALRLFPNRTNANEVREKKIKQNWTEPWVSECLAVLTRGREIERDRGLMRGHLMHFKRLCNNSIQLQVDDIPSTKRNGKLLLQWGFGFWLTMQTKQNIADDLHKTCIHRIQKQVAL